MCLQTVNLHRKFFLKTIQDFLLRFGSAIMELSATINRILHSYSSNILLPFRLDKNKRQATASIQL